MDEYGVRSLFPMNPSRLLHYELYGFLFLLAALLAYRALTGKLPLTGLLQQDADNRAVAPERVQLLMATLFVSALYVREVLHNGNAASMPDVSNAVLVVFGGSGAAYTAVKALRFKKLATILERKFQ